MNKYFGFLFWIVFLFVLFPINSFSQPSADPEALRGPAFYSPELKNETMPPGWDAKKILYPEKYAKADLVVTLDQHFYPAAKPLIEAYAKSSGLNIVAQEGTCGVSSGMVAKKQVDISSFCCPPAPSDRLPGLVFHTVGIIANVFIVPPDNPITNVTYKEAQQIFSGEMGSWPEISDPTVAGFRRPINVHTRLHCKLRPGHWRALLDTEDQFAPMIQNASSIPDMLDHVASDPNGIGWVARWLLEQDENDKRLKMVRIDGVHPDDKDAVAKGRYPTYKLLNLTTWGGPHAKKTAQQLVHYLMDRLDQLDPKMHIITVDKLRASGWQFQGNEIIGEPTQ